MPTDPQPLTLAEAVRLAVEACETEPDGAPLEELERRFEDDDEPIRAIEDIEGRVDEELGRIDVDWEDSAPLSMARAAILYLAYRRDEGAADSQTLLRLSARAEYDGTPPPHVARWLEEVGAGA